MDAPQATSTGLIGRIKTTLQKVLKDPTLDTQGFELLATLAEKMKNWIRKDTDKESQFIR